MPDPTPVVRHEYRPRPTRFLGVRDVAGYRLKVYGIRFDGRDPAADVFPAGWRLAAAALPQPPTAQGRFGVGFAVEHRGRGMDYLVLCWWGSENELFVRVFTTMTDDVAGWQMATSGTVACVWDLLVVGFERDAFVDTVLSREGVPDLEAYLGCARADTAVVD